MVIENILILGLGGIGLHVAKRLIHEGYTLTIIESDPKLSRYAREHVDARVIEGNVMQLNHWLSCNAEDMDLLIAVTQSDSTNMLASLIADRLGIQRKIVRVRSLDFGRDNSVLTMEDLKIDLIIHPEELIAREFARLVQRSAANDVIEIGDEGQMQVLAFHVYENSPLAHRQLKEASLQLHVGIPFRVVALARGISTVIPTGEDYILPHDQIFVMAHQEHISRIMDLSGVQSTEIHRLMILGGGMVGRRVAELLENEVQIKLIEQDSETAEHLASTLSNTQVLHGDGTDANVMALAGLPDMQSFIATSGNNETNIISCLLAKHLMNKDNRDPNGAEGKTLALVDKEDYLVLASTIGLDIALNARISAANEILKFIRRSELLSVAHLHGVDAEVIEIEAAHNSLITKKPLHKLKSHLQQRGIIIGGYRREDEWKVAMGDTHIQSGERVIVVCLSQQLREIRKLFH